LQLQVEEYVRNNISSSFPLAMADMTQAEVPANTSAGHISVHVEGAHPVAVPFLFERQQKRMSGAIVASIASHVAVAVLFVLAVRFGAKTAVALGVLPEQPNDQIIWLAQKGPGGGGGGGGNQMKEPPRKVELPGKDKITVPVAKPPKLEVVEEPKVEPNPVEQVVIPAKSLASAAESLPGAIEAPPGLPPSLSQGSGTGGGAGTGSGTGIGPGRGSGLGPGFGGGTGGGAYRPGNGVTVPKLLREVKPQYTSDAMRAKVQGTVMLECVVRTDGTVGDVTVIRGLDPTFGLDQEAIKAAKQWRFVPGSRMGEPVPVLISIELTFTLR